jgi:hypothetical protein
LGLGIFCRIRGSCRFFFCLGCCGVDIRRSN